MTTPTHLPHSPPTAAQPAWLPTPLATTSANPVGQRSTTPAMPCPTPRHKSTQPRNATPLLDRSLPMGPAVSGLVLWREFAQSGNATVLLDCGLPTGKVAALLDRSLTAGGVTGCGAVSGRMPCREFALPRKVTALPGGGLLIGVAMSGLVRWRGFGRPCNVTALIDHSRTTCVATSRVAARCFRVAWTLADLDRLDVDLVSAAMDFREAASPHQGRPSASCVSGPVCLPRCEGSEALFACVANPRAAAFVESVSQCAANAIVPGSTSFRRAGTNHVSAALEFRDRRAA